MKKNACICFISVILIISTFLPVVSAKTIGILSAMPAELETLKRKISNQAENSSGIIKGEIGTHTVYATLSGIGKVNAAATAQKLISEYKIDILIFSGVAGGINPAFNVGDIVFVVKAFQHDFGYLGDKFNMHAVGTVPELGIGTGNETVYFDLKNYWPKEVWVNLEKKATQFSNTFTSVTVNGSEYLPVLNLNGIVATGDQFIANDAKKRSLLDQKADIVEMEGAAVVQVTHKNSIPCLILRSISDKAGEKADIDFQHFFKTVAKNNSFLVAHLVKQLP